MLPDSVPRILSGTFFIWRLSGSMTDHQQFLEMIFLVLSVKAIHSFMQ